MKKIIAFFTFLLSCLISSAQVENEAISHHDYIEVVLEKDTSPQQLITPFSSVAIMDARDNCNEIGYYSTGTLVKGWPKLYQLKPTLEKAVTDWSAYYLQLHKQPITDISLFVVIKKFWLSAEAAPALLANDKRGQPNEGFEKGVVANIEFYLREDSAYYPLYRIDSTYIFDEKLPANAGMYINGTLKKTFDKLLQYNWADIAKMKRKLSLQDIKTAAGKNNNCPVLLAQTYPKGIYKTFEDFKKNTPLQVAFELQPSEMGDILYVKENNIECPKERPGALVTGPIFLYIPVTNILNW